MAENIENVFDIGIGTAVDNEGLEKGLKEAEAAGKKSAEEQAKATEEGAKKQSDSVKKHEEKKTKSTKEESKKREETIKKENKSGIDSLKGFAAGAGKELLGMDQLLGAVAGGPAMLGKAFVDMAQQAAAALDQMAEAYRQQEEAERLLQNAASNNPYLNDRNVNQLKKYADEVQRTTGIDNVLVLRTETRLASLGRNQKQIEQIVKAATDLSASGVMGFDEAVNELNRSLNGVIGRASGQLIPELKNLSKEELAAGAAIEMLGQKVEGSAAEAMQTGAGSVKAYENAVGDLKKIIGQGWEEATAPGRKWLTDIINKFNEAQQAKKTIYEALQDTTSDEELIFANLSDAERKRLEQIGYSAGADLGAEINARLGEMDYLSATEDALRTLAQVNNVNVEVFRQVLLDSKSLGQEIKNYLVLLGEKTKAEREAGKAGEAAHRAVAAAIAIETQEALNAAAAANRAVLDAQQAAKEGNLEAAKEANQRAAQIAGTLEAELAAIQEKNRRTEDQDDILKNINKNLENEKKKILDMADIEGKSRNDLEVRQKILQAELKAYQDIQQAINDIVADGGTVEAELTSQAEARKRALTSTTAAYKDEAQKAEEAKKAEEERLRQIAKLHEDNRAALKKYYDDAVAEAERLADVKKRAEFEGTRESLSSNPAAEKAQKDMTDLVLRFASEREKALRDVANQEYEYEIELNNRKYEEEQKKLGEYYTEVFKNDKLTAEERVKINEEYSIASGQLTSSRIQAELEAEQKKNEALKQFDKDLLDKRLSQLQQYTNYASQAANSIGSIWGSVIENETASRLEALDEEKYADEERARRGEIDAAEYQKRQKDRAKEEKKINMEMAHEKYKLDLYQYGVNIVTATANAALAVIKALAEFGPVGAGIVGALGALQVAAVVAAKPQPPRFHTGGIVQGSAGQEVPAILKAGEVVSTSEQFQNTMRAISHLASPQGAGSGTTLNFKVENHSSAHVAEPSFDGSTIELLITEKVSSAMGAGQLDNGFNSYESRRRGMAIE